MLYERTNMCLCPHGPLQDDISEDRYLKWNDLTERRVEILIEGIYEMEEQTKKKNRPLPLYKSMCV